MLSYNCTPYQTSYLLVHTNTKMFIDLCSQVSENWYFYWMILCEDSIHVSVKRWSIEVLCFFYYFDSFLLNFFHCNPHSHKTPMNWVHPMSICELWTMKYVQESCLMIAGALWGVRRGWDPPHLMLWPARTSEALVRGACIYMYSRNGPLNSTQSVRSLFLEIIFLKLLHLAKNSGLQAVEFRLIQDI